MPGFAVQTPSPMKTSLLLAAACGLFLTAPVARAQTVNAAIKSEQLAEIKDYLTAKPGEVVKLKFNRRGEYRGLAADGTVSSSVHFNYSDEAMVLVPPELTDWFRKISAESSKTERVSKYVFAIAEVPGTTAIPGHKLLNFNDSAVRDMERH